MNGILVIHTEVQSGVGGYCLKWNMGVFLLWSSSRKGLTILIGLDKSGYQVNSFLITRQKLMLWVLIRSASMRRF